MFESFIPLTPPISDKSRTDQADAMVAQRRLRCWGHIVNIVATSFVFIKKENRTREIALSAVAKGHKLNTFVRQSSQRREAFKREVRAYEAGRNPLDRQITTHMVDEFLGEDDNSDDEDGDGIFQAPIYDSEEEEDESGCPLKVHNDTRWNGVLTEVDSCLTFKEAIDHFCYLRRQLSYRNSNRVNLEITVEEWRCLEEIRSILKPFEETTLWHEGNRVALDTVMASLYEVEKHLRDKLARFELLPEEEEDDVGFLLSIQLHSVFPLPSYFHSVFPLLSYSRWQHILIAFSRSRHIHYANLFFSRANFMIPSNLPPLANPNTLRHLVSVLLSAKDSLRNAALKQ